MIIPSSIHVSAAKSADTYHLEYLAPVGVILLFVLVLVWLMFPRGPKPPRPRTD